MDYDISSLSKMLLPELRTIAKGLGMKRIELLKKQDLINKIIEVQSAQSSKGAEEQSLERQPRKRTRLSGRPERVMGVSLNADGAETEPIAKPDTPSVHKVITVPSYADRKRIDADEQSARQERFAPRFARPERPSYQKNEQTADRSNAEQTHQSEATLRPE